MVSRYFDKPAAFVRSSRRFLVPETSCLRVRLVGVGGQLANRPTTTGGVQFSIRGLAVSSFGKAAMAERGE